MTDPDDPSQNVTDAGRTIIDMSRANYANAVQMDTLNKRQGEMRYSQGREDGLWVRVRHDDIGKKSSFRLDNTMIEVGGGLIHVMLKTMVNSIPGSRSIT